MVYYREGSLKIGDRLLSVDGIPLHSVTHADALNILRQCSQEALFQIEYDVTIMGKARTTGVAFALTASKVRGAIVNCGVTGFQPQSCCLCGSKGSSSKLT